MSSERFQSGDSENARAEQISHPPKATVYCHGTPMFRSRAARDLGCLLDVDPDVQAWECQPLELQVGNRHHAPDFLVTYIGGIQWLLDACDGQGDRAVTEAALQEGYRHRFVPREERESGFRLRNARDLLRYGHYRCPLGDRIRIIATLDEVGSFSVAEALGLFREVSPMAGLASLILQRMLAIELDEALINPDTIVRRF